MLSNFTLERGIADHYGTLVVETTLTPDRVALAADSLLPVETADGLSDHEAEMRVFGSPPVCVRTDDLLLPGLNRSLTDAITNPGSNDSDVDDVVAGIVSLIADTTVQLSRSASERLVEWYKMFVKRSPETALALQNDLAAVVHPDTDPP
jgi:hypothetical protein